MKGLKRYYNFLALITIFFCIGYPFITYFHVEKASGMELEYFAKKSKIVIDMFYYQKEKVLFLFSLFLLAGMILGAVFYYIFYEKFPGYYLPDRGILLAVTSYFFLNILSVFFSEYKEYGFMGSCIDYEGIAAIFGYMVLFFGGFVLFRKEKTEKWLRAGMEILSVLVILGTFLEIILGPFFNIEWVRKLLTPDRYEHLLENVHLNYYGNAALTFGNPGFFGGFCVLLFTVFLGTALWEKNRKRQIFDMLLTGGLLFCIFMSGSSGALYSAVIVSVLEVLFWSRREGWRKGIRSAAVIAAVTIVLLVAVQLTSDQNEDGIWKKIKDSVGNPQYTKEDTVFTVKKIQLDQGKLEVEGEKETFTVQIVGQNKDDLGIENVKIEDGKGREVKTERAEEGWQLRNEFSEVKFSIVDRTISFDFGYEDPVEFYVVENNLYYIDFKGSLLNEIPQPKIDIGEKIGSVFTGRGYIWLSCLPVLKEVFILGKGIGSFPFVYPQSEVAGMLNIHGSADYCIEQAHSWYLQVAVNSGIFSLICLLYVFACVFRKGYQERKQQGGCWKNFIFWGILGYLLVGIVNNSCVAGAPLFWLLLGVYLGKDKLIQMEIL
nr:O-antigen ligase family protein [uncultured Faecalimonas sp.]